MSPKNWDYGLGARLHECQQEGFGEPSAGELPELLRDDLRDRVDEGRLELEQA